MLTIFGNKKEISVHAANRLQRCTHILSAFDYETHFVSSDKNTADFLSRLPTSEREGNRDKIAYIKFIFQCVMFILLR